MSKTRVQITNRQNCLEFDGDAVLEAISSVLRQEGRQADLSVAVVGREEIAELNGRFLRRDGPTDVLAFPYGEEEGMTVGEIVVCADVAVSEAAQRAHSAEDELLLYVVHGLLHLLGYDDHEAAGMARMRERECELLLAMGRPVSF